MRRIIIDKKNIKNNLFVIGFLAVILLVPLVLEAFPDPNILPNIAKFLCWFPFICISIATVTLIKSKSYTSLPEAFASPPPNTVPPI